MNLTAQLTALREETRGLTRSEEHTSELQSQSNLVCRLLLEKKKIIATKQRHRPYSETIVETVLVEALYLPARALHDTDLPTFIEQRPAPVVACEQSTNAFSS